MELHPEPQPDGGTLAEKVKEALLLHTESAGIDVKVDVQDGVVRLHGIVDTYSQVHACVEIARQVPGVRRVENDLTVHSEKGWTDARARRELNRRLAARDSTEAVSAEMVNGSVTLVGHVARAEDRDEALRIARGVPAVKGVVSRIKVGAGREEDDALISRYAKRLISQMGYDPGDFTIWAENGVVHIRGLVDSHPAASRIRSLLRRIEGVVRVDALLPVDPDQGRGAAVPTGRGGKTVH